MADDRPLVSVSIRQRLEQKIQTAWFQKNLAVFLWPLVPLSWLFGIIAALRRKAYANAWLKSGRLPVPVVVVGNLIAGGAGKTPLTLNLVAQLRAAGRRPGIVSRGYGGQGEVREVTVAEDPAQVGDEPLLLAARSGVPVFVGRKRFEAGQALLAAYPQIDVLVCDDGLQHYALARDVEVVVSDRRGFGNGYLLPAGPLREPPTRLKTVDACVVHAGAEAPGAAFEMDLLPGPFYSLNDSALLGEPGDWSGRRVHAMAGIGHPERFFDTLRSLGIDFESHPFPDHYAYRAHDLAFAQGAVLLMTEKDAVKCRPFYRGEAWVLPVTAHVSPALTALVLERIGNGRQAA